MNVKRTIATAVILSLVAAALPATAWAADDSKNATAPKAPAVDLRASTARALASVTGEPVQVATPPAARNTGRRNAAKGGGGGGGGMGAVMAVVGIAASIGATYFVIKEMHKTESQLTATPTPQVVR
ncbi:MAG TPA: hypothetical protein VLT86_19425 [Vicinamibacterales bacterium]|nr:hypothetical protein [Vicinamibacterales bacterium]